MMKNILITGKNSFVGTAVETYLRSFDGYLIDTLDMESESWRQHSFEGYDCVFHVAGIAHVPSGKLGSEQENRYYRVNCDLALETAQMAKNAGVRQFIFMSSAIVYGESGAIGQCKRIERDTPPDPSNAYADSKLRAETALEKMQNADFSVALVRPPMIYGPGCKGNYPLLSRAARILPCFPKIYNERSMLYIGHLTPFIKALIDGECSGIFWPQNSEYVNTSELVRIIAAVHGRKIMLVPGFTWLMRLLSKRMRIINKVFGNLTYAHPLSDIVPNYRLLSFKETIERTEQNA